MNLRNNPQAPVAQYLATRKLAPESIQRFSLGMSLDSWDSAMVFAKNLGFTEAELAEGGIIRTFEDNPSKRYDLFRNRLMFPIWDELGRVVGFSARTIESDPKAMKYVNTPETPIFKKGRILYGMHLARSEMSDNKLGCAILCEGQLDVIAMHAAGFPNSVAAEGTAFTPEQARMLRRYTGKIKLALDSDAAGTKAVFKDAEILLPLGFEVKVVRFPGGKDPDELLKQQGREAIAEAVEQATDFFDFALNEFIARNGNTPAGKAKSAADMLQLFSLLESEAAKTAYTSWLAETLGLSSDGLYAELVRTARKEAERKERYARYEQERDEKRTPEPVAQAPETQAQKRYKKALFEILEVLLEYEEITGIACEQIPPELLDQTPVAVAVNEVIQAKMLDEWSDAAAHIIEKLEPQGLINQELSLMLMGKEEEPEPPIPEGLTEDQLAELKKDRQRAFNRKKKLALKVFEEDLKLLKEYSLNVRMERLMERFARLAPDDPEKLNLMNEITALTRERVALRK
jgi:DNA primase